jgi:hypothetical protein
VRHAPDGVLRRLEDEPFAISDVTFAHVSQCRRCKARRDSIAADAKNASRRLGAPQLVADVDRGWSDFLRRLDASRLDGAPRRPSYAPPRWNWGARVSVRTGLVAAAAAMVIGGTAAAATLTNVFEPTHVAPVSVNASDVQALAGFMSFGDTSSEGGFPTPTGSGNLPFGTLHWTSTAIAQEVSSPSQAEAMTGLRLAQPSHLPSGVGTADKYVVQPKVGATLTFNSSAGSLAGATVTLEAGPAIFIAYGSQSSSLSLPTMGILTMQRPTATSSGATMSQIESFLLSRPGIPPQLAEEIRLLGNISTVLPVPTPTGLNSKQVHVSGHPGVLISDRSGIASGVVWEDGSGIVHAVGGLINQQNVLDVANQLG